MFRSSTAKLAAVYTGIFAAAVVILALVTVMALRSGLSQLFDMAIRNESAALSTEYASEGLNAVLQAVRDRDATAGHMSYAVERPGGGALAGRLAGQDVPDGWSNFRLAGPNGPERLRTYGVALPSGYRLIVGDDASRAEALDGAVLRGFAGALAFVLVVGGASGYALSRGVHRRLVAITATAEAIIDGELQRRVPTGAGGDDLDRLAVTLNRMLDRISGLMESLRQVSSDIAHDLRTPLNRLRQHLEQGQSQPTPEGQAAAFEGALAELGGILETFSALLRITEIEAGARRAGFQRVDLAKIAAEVVEAFTPSAADEGRALTLRPGPPVLVEGDAELLTQLLVNLVENGLRHTPPGSRIEVGAELEAGRAVLCVADDGPGVAPAERARVLERFYRLEASRTTSGSGLGLALVAAIARLHDAELSLGDAGPGLRVLIGFPP